MSKIVVGLTGLIGSGKTTVSNYLADIGMSIIDTDVIASQIISSPKFINQLMIKFGSSIATDGVIDRSVLRNIVFKDELSRLELESIIHPQIFENVVEQLTAANQGFLILVVPLLFRSNKYLGLVDYSIFIDVKLDKIMRQVRSRSKLEDEMILKIIDSQVLASFQRHQANYVVRNSDGKDNLFMEIDKIVKEIKYGTV